MIKRISFFILSTLSFFLPILAFAQTPAIVSINPNIPGAQNISTVGPCGWIANFYTFALIIAGILAFGAVVYGGFKYAISAGNPSSQSEGRAWIWSALLGILLLGGAYVILSTINPNLVKCSLPTLSGVPANIGGGGAGSTSGGNPFGGGGSSGGGGASSDWTQDNCASGPCQTLPNCQASSRVNCGGAQGMVNTLNCIQQQDPNFNVSEGYPPTDQDPRHLVGGHSNGCAVDVTVPNTGGGTCANVQALLTAEANCGVSNIANNNEYYTCGGRQYGQTTGQNVHINAQKGQGGC